MNKCRFISEGYVFLASIDEISKSKRPKIAYFLEERRCRFHGYQIHNFWEQPAVLYCSDNSTNSTKDQEEPFSNLKIEPEDLEGDRGDRVNYTFFLIYFMLMTILIILAAILVMISVQ